MKSFITALLIIVCFSLQAQKIDKLIKEKSVRSIVATLAADDMKGRAAMDAASINKAAAYLENYFKDLKLDPLPGLNGHRQEFAKEQITPGAAVVTINGTTIDPKLVLPVHERAKINFTSGLTVKTIAARPDEENKSKVFFGALAAIMGDTASALIVVDPSYEAGFNQLKKYLGKRIAGGQPGVKVFVLHSGPVESYQITHEQHLESLRMANVGGMIKGKSRPDEYIIFSSHYDHIGIQSPVEGDSIANGADDDASGTAAVLSLARYFKKVGNNERSIIFVAFTAEEIGGFGSQYFSHQLDPAKVMAMFNIEMIGKPSKWGPGAAFITGFERTNFGTICQKNLEGSGFTFHPDPYPEQNLFFRSDNATLAMQGVPAHSISTDQIPDDKLYHTVNDEIESLDFKNITATIKAIALSAKTMISGEDTPTRVNMGK